MEASNAKLLTTGRRRRMLFPKGFARVRRTPARVLGVVAACALVSCSSPSPRDHAAQSASAKSAAIFPADAKGVPQRVRLMTQEQFANSLGYIFGPDIRVDARFAPM